MAQEEKNVQKNQSVKRALRILKLLAERGEPVGVREIARHFGYSASIVQRLLATMAEEGFVDQSIESSRYVIGHSAFQVGSTFLSKSDLLTSAMPELRNMSERAVTGFLGVLRGQKVIYMAAMQGNGPIAIKSEVGSSASLHTTALGKALIAELPETTVRELLSGGLEKFTEKSITSVDELIDQLARVRRDGYAINDCENRANVYSVGVAVKDASNTVVGAISGAVAITMLDDHEREELIELVIDAGRRVSHRLGAPTSVTEVYGKVL